MSREEMMLAAAVNGTSIDINDINPRTRKELLLAHMCGCEGISEEDLPEPRTREEMYLRALCEGGGSGGSGSGGPFELVFESNFTVAETINSTSITTVATITTGLQLSTITDLYCVIVCTNDTEADTSFKHVKARTQSPVVGSGGYVNHNDTSGIVYNSGGMASGTNRGLFLDGVGRYAATLYIRARGDSSVGYVVSGDYNIKLYKANYGYFGLEGI